MHNLVLGLIPLVTLAGASTTCSDLVTFTSLLEVDSVVITSASTVAANSTSGAPSYCDVVGQIGGRIGVWFKLPDGDAWNTRYTQYGCGGACGYNPFEDGTDPVAPLAAGYAIGTTDMGNNASSFAIFYDNFQARIDWSYLATHLTAIAGKKLVSYYYGTQPTFSYHSGGSTGGRQGLVEAQRYPGEFDGIVAVAPAYDETGITLRSIAWNGQATVKNDSAYTPVLTLEDAEIIQQAVLQACDLTDGAADGIISDPRACQFDLDTLVCQSSFSNTSTCLTSEAIEAARKLYSVPVNSTGAPLLPENLLPGSEFAWAGSYISTTAGEAAGFTAFGGEYATNYAFWPSPKDTISPLDISMDLSDSDTVYMDSLHYGGMADLRVFKNLGSKLLMFQGLGDPAVAPSFALDYYLRVVTAAGGREAADDFVLFYEMPGVGHVSGGPGADTFDGLAAVAAWVERGIKPYNITAAHLNSDGSIAFTRPLYPWPELPFYEGYGNVNESASWSPKNSTASTWWSLQ